MGKKGSGQGVNTKVAAAKEHQAAILESRSAKARAEQEAAEAREWAQGAKGSKREDEVARKQDEKMAKAAAKKALEDAEAKELQRFKSTVVGVVRKILFRCYLISCLSRCVLYNAIKHPPSVMCKFNEGFDGYVDVQKIHVAMCCVRFFIVVVLGICCLFMMFFQHM